MSPKISLLSAVLFATLYFLKHPRPGMSFFASFFVLLFLYVTMHRKQLAWKYPFLGAGLFSIIFLAKHNIGLYLCFGLGLSHIWMLARIYAKERNWNSFLPPLRAAILDAFLALFGIAVLIGQAILLRSGYESYADLIVFAKKYASSGLMFSSVWFWIVHGILVTVALAVIISLWAQRNNKLDAVYAWRSASFAGIALGMTLQGFAYYDLIHLFDGLGLAALFLLVSSQKKLELPLQKWFRRSLFVGIFVLVLISAVMLGRYLEDFREGVDVRGILLVSSPVADLIDTGLVLRGEPKIYVFPDDAMLYVLSGAHNPTRYNQLLAHHTSREEQREIIASLTQSRPLLVLRDNWREHPEYDLLKEYFSRSVFRERLGSFELREMP